MKHIVRRTAQTTIGSVSVDGDKLVVTTTSTLRWFFQHDTIVETFSGTVRRSVDSRVDDILAPEPDTYWVADDSGALLAGPYTSYLAAMLDSRKL